MSRSPLRSLLLAAADLSIVGSYSRIGFELASPTFDPEALRVDLRGRVAVVTGANSGLGFATASAIAAAGATTVLVGRNPARLAEAVERIRTLHADAELRSEVADLAELDDVRALAGRLVAKYDAIDVLVQNAGVMLHERTLTRDRYERTFATNVLGPFVLQTLLDRQLRAAVHARVVHVTSGGMYSQPLDLAKLQGAIEPWDGVVSYAQTKRAQVLLNERWAVEYAQSRVTSNAMHPGWADTPGVATSLPKFRRVMGSLLRDSEQGADTAIWLAISPQAASFSGKLFLDRKPRRTHLTPFTRGGDRFADALWELCRAAVSRGPGVDAPRAAQGGDAA